MFTRSTILDFTGKKLALSFIAHELVDGQRPPYVHLASTRRHSRDRFSQAFPVFRTLPLPCIILNENRRTKNGGGLGTRLSTPGDTWTCTHIKFTQSTDQHTPSPSL